MALDLDKINAFFKDYRKQTQLPDDIVKTLTSGSSLKYEGLELTLKDRNQLHKDISEVLEESYCYIWKPTNDFSKFFVLYLKNGTFMLYGFPAGRLLKPQARTNESEQIWDDKRLPLLAKEIRVKKVYSRIMNDLEKSSSEFFSYSGSAHGQNNRSVVDAYKGITEDLDVLEKLASLGIVPKLEVGSRSQSSHEFSTNYCLDTFKEVGISDANQMIALAEAGITPFHLEHFKNAGRKVQRKRNDLVDVVKEFYGTKFVPAKGIVNDLYRNHTKTYSPNPKERDSTIKDWEMVFAQRLCGD